MRKIFAMALVPVFFGLATPSALALRCGNNLVSIGDLKQEVRLKCGEPYSKEVIGYIDHETSGNRIRVMKIEEWILRVSNRGSVYFHSLVFEGNKLIEIKPAGQEK